MARGGRFTALSGVCNHAGGPLGEGTLDGDTVVCPWHWSAEDMENNVRTVQTSSALHEGTRALVDRAVDMAELLMTARGLVRGGRKAQTLEP